MHPRESEEPVNFSRLLDTLFWIGEFQKRFSVMLYKAYYLPVIIYGVNV